MRNQEGALRARLWDKESFPRILPFALFMMFIGIEEIARLLSKFGSIEFNEHLPYILYPAKTLIVAATLVAFSSRYSEVKLKDLRRLSPTLLSFASGLLIFVLWINLDFFFSVEGGPSGFNPNVLDSSSLRWGLIAIRLSGAVVVVPIMEELFWRSFLIRYIINSDFETVPIGRFSWSSFLISSVLFGLEHNLLIAGIMAGVGYNLLLYRTRSIVQCILAHAITNLALGVYVLYSGQWYFW